MAKTTFSGPVQSDGGFMTPVSATPLVSFTLTQAEVGGNYVINGETNGGPSGAITVTLPDESSSSINGFTYTAQTVSYPDGSLLRSKNGYKVYVIKGLYKRWMQHQDIFNMYGHLSWDDIIDVEPEVLDQYQDAWLVRAAGDKRVYEVNADGTKHWLNMTASQFSTSGRLWDMVFIVNSFERDFYNTGADVYFSG